MPDLALQLDSCKHMAEFLLIPRDEHNQLLRRFEALQKLIEGHLQNGPQLQDWIDEKKAQALLGLKTTKLWALRKTGELRHSRIGNKVFYSVNSINELLHKNAK